jgi:hypothetical protein
MLHPILKFTLTPRRIACSSIASINSSSVMFASADCSLTLMLVVSRQPQRALDHQI